MRGAFVAAVADPGAALPPHLVELLTRDAPPPGVGFNPRAHVAWCSTDGRTSVAAWQDRDPHEREIWRRDDRGIAVVCGQVRRAGRPWRPASEWPEEIRPLARENGESGPLEDVVGLYAGIAADTDGNGIAITDPLSLRFLYRSRGSTWTVISSNPHLAAWCAVDPTARPERDALSVCSLAATGYRLIPFVGYEGVEVLRPGSYVRLAAGDTPTVVPRPAIWWPTDEQRAMSDDELVELAAASVAENVAASTTYPAELVVADLTGGKDSRLILAGAMLAGVVDDLYFFTRGPENLPDVAIARELSEMFDFTHLNGPALAMVAHAKGITFDAQLELPGTWTERARWYTTTIAGMDNLWQGIPLDDEVSMLQLGGLFGEALRSALPWTLPTEAHLVDWFDRRINRLFLLRDESRECIRDALLDDVLDDPTGGEATYEDLHDWHLLELQIRRNFGPREETKAYQRQLPTYALDAVRSGFAMGSRARMTHAVHRGITERASPRLATHRYVDGGWPCEPRQARPIRGPRAGPPKRWPERPPVAIDDAPSLGMFISAKQKDERLALLRDLTDERNNPAWDHIDRELVIDLTDHYSSMSKTQQLELMGAATAAIWLSHDNLS